MRSERNTVLTEVEEQVRTAIQEANAQITNLEHRDPTELLTTEELERANQKRAFAVDAAETLDTGSLVSRLEAVLSGGDKGAIFAAWSGGQRRRARILERRRENARRASDNPGVATQVTHATELDDVLGRMHGALDGGRTASEIEAAKQRIGEAFDLQQAAHLGIREQGSVYSPQYAVPGPQ